MEVLQYILGVVVIVVGLLLSIGLHELGHLIPAKRFGVFVPQYMIGLGPTLWSRKFGETEYGVKAIPLGGYISMAGMFPPERNADELKKRSRGLFNTLMQDARTASEESLLPAGENRAFYRLAIWKRIIIMLGGPTMNLIIGIVLIAVVTCGIGAAQTTTAIGEVSPCVPVASSQNQGCTASDPTSPAAEAGLKPGDRILSIDGTSITTWDQATMLIRAAPNAEMKFAVERAGKKINISVTPAPRQRPALAADGSTLKDANGKDLTETVGVLGVTTEPAYIPQSPTEIAPAVGQTIVAVATSLANLPARVVDLARSTFGSQKRDPNGLIGVVGIGRLGGDIATSTSYTFTEQVELFLSVLASLNIALFVFNLIPLLPLDGGHVAGALWEGIRRFFAKIFKRRDPGPVDIAKLIPLTFSVVVLLVGLTVFLVIADIVKPITLQ